jgi:nucleotide-binding universal stress UspA family protein
VIDIRRILCPVDFSDASRHALEHATAVAGWYDSRLLVLHVWAPPFPVVPPLLFSEPDHLELPAEAVREEFLARLRQWAAGAAAAGCQVDVELVTGNPAAKIVERAGAYEAHLIVMGTHGRGGFERLMIGSVAERVLHRAACPVLTIPPPAVTTSKLPFKRLLSAVDFSEPSLVAFRFAVSIAKESGAHLTVLHAIEWPLDEEMAAFDTPEFRQVIEDQTRARVGGLLTDDMRTWCEVDTTIAYGKPYREILDVAGRDDTDLIVMGVHGRNALDLMLFGSTTNQVVRRASCPVLTLKR